MAGMIETSRRSIVNWILGIGSGTVFAAIIYPVARFMIPPETPEAATSQVLACTVQELDQEGWKIFRFGQDAGILIRTEEGEIRAFNATCTHLSCTVQYRRDLRRIWCACHNGEFDLNGVNVAGPPPTPLVRYEVSVSGDEIWVSRT